jgi:outer membrane protein OmpA-like peptidoglycan-associated protein
VGKPVQAGCGLESGSSVLRHSHFCLVIALLLAGCSSLPSAMNPVSWWHDLQGGKIAEQRPPPPGADQPYPNLATVPPKPAQPDRAALTNIASALIADRTNAQHLAAATPIPDPSSPSASPGLFGRGTVPPPAPPPPPGTQTASATMPAAEAPPAPPAPAQASTSGAAGAAPSRAPVAAVQSTPLGPPGEAAQPPSVEAAAPPPLPTTPPPAPKLPGVASPPPPPAAASPPAPPPPPAPSPVAAAPPPPAAPPPVPAAPPPAPVAAAPSPPAAPPAPPRTVVAEATPAPKPAANPADTVSVTFVTGSAVLQGSAADTLKQLAARRGSGIIAVTGYGDAASSDPDAQSAALTLGLSRAQAMAAALTAAGVPSSAVQVDAAAIGRGGTARLVQ